VIVGAFRDQFVAELAPLLNLAQLFVRWGAIMEAMRQSWTDERLDDFREHVDQRFDQMDQRFERIEAELRMRGTEINEGF